MAGYRDISNIVVEDAQIMFRNFSGKESMYNKAGVRGFSLRIDDEAFAQKLSDDGWNVKILAPREGDDTVRHHLPVAVNYANVPPMVYLVTKRNKTLLDETTIETLDYAEIVTVDLTITPYQWQLPTGQSGVKAYLKTMYVTIEEDEFAHKYDDFE